MNSQHKQQQEDEGIMQGDVRGVLGHCLSPPPSAAVEGALTLLRQIGALDGAEELTALGHHLKQMPMDPRWVGESVCMCVRACVCVCVYVHVCIPFSIN